MRLVLFTRKESLVDQVHPSSFAIDANALQTTTGSIHTMNTGSIGRANILLVPVAPQTVNRFVSSGDHAAVELMGKSPYLSANVGGLTNFEWTLPAATSQDAVSATLQRASAATGSTLVTLSGSREDVTARLQNPAPTVALSVQQSGNAPGTTNPQPVGWTTTTGGTTGRVDVTHVDADTGQVLSSYVTGATGTTSLQATGAEPARITLSATSAPSGAGLQTTDVGTLLRLDVQNPTTQLTAQVTRGTCDATAPFQGSFSTQNTGATGPAKLFIGDGGQVPNVQWWQSAVDARCRGAQAHVGIQMDAIQDTHWDTTSCMADYRFEAFGNKKSTYYVDTGNGFLDASGRLQSQVHGSIDFGFVPGDGVQHTATSRLATLEEKVTFPTCMEFRDSPVQWYTLKAVDAAGDLHLNINPQQINTGEFLPTLQLESLAGSSTASIDLDARLQSQEFDQFHDANLLASSPIGKLDAFIGSAGKEIRRNEGDTDGFQFVLDGGDLNWHMQFKGLQKLEGWAKRDCWLPMSYDVDYQRDPAAGPRWMHDVLDLDVFCDMSRLEMRLPSAIKYRVSAPSMIDAGLTIVSSSDTIPTLRLWGMASCGHFFSGLCGSGLFLFLQVGLEQIPAGPSDFRFLFQGPQAVTLRVQAAGGGVGRADIGLSFGASDYYVSLGLTDVKMNLDWDLDGDTRFPGIPRYFFCDSNPELTGSLRVRAGPIGLGLGLMGGIQCNDIQIRQTGTLDLWFVELPIIQFSGSISVNELVPVLEVCLMGHWFKIPIPPAVILWI